MPARPTRRPADPDAGPAIVDERASLAAVPPQQATRDVPRATAPETTKPRKFTALVDAETDARFGRLLDQLRASAGPVATRPDGNGRTRAGYDLSRADLLRALLQVAEDDASVMQTVDESIRRHYGAT